MKQIVRHISLRIEDDLRRRFRYIAKYYGLTANSQMLNMIRRLVDDFEKEHGVITEEDLKQTNLMDD